MPCSSAVRPAPDVRGSPLLISAVCSSTHIDVVLYRCPGCRQASSLFPANDVGRAAIHLFCAGLRTPLRIAVCGVRAADLALYLSKYVNRGVAILFQRTPSAEQLALYAARHL